MVNKENSQMIPTLLSAYVYLLHCNRGESIRKINKRYPQYSRNTIWRHATKDLNEAQKRKTVKEGEGEETNKDAKICVKNMIETLHLSKYNISLG